MAPGGGVLPYVSPERHPLKKNDQGEVASVLFGLSDEEVSVLQIAR